MMRRETGRMIGGWRSVVAPQAYHVGPKHDEERHDRGQAPLQAAGRPNAEERSHKESQVEAAGVDEQSFQDVRVAAQMGPSHAAVS